MSKHLLPLEELAKVIAEADKIRAQRVGVSPLVKELVAFWNEERPKMAAQYSRNLEDLAIVVADRHDEAVVDLITRVGMNPSDAQMEVAGILMMEPEVERDDGNSLA